MSLIVSISAPATGLVHFNDMPRMKVRRADISEACHLSTFVSDLSRVHIGPTLQEEGIERLLQSMDTESTVRRFRDGFPHWVAINDTLILGVVVVKPPSHIYHLFVNTDQQREGIGRILLNRALRYILEEQHRDLVTVNASLNSVDAYKSFGFAESSDICEDGGVRFQPMSQTLVPESE